MAKTDNLSDFLTDVANSIRTKTGTTDPINAQDFSDKILSISTLKGVLDATKDATFLFDNYKGTSVDGLIQYNDTENVTEMRNMFQYCTNLTTVPLFNTGNVTTMNQMFDRCTALTTIPQFDTSNVISMSYMFMDCTSLTTIPQLNTSNVKDAGMHKMFYNCQALTSIPLLDTSKVTDMGFMFYNCRALTTIPLLDTSKVTNMNSMFSGCTNLTTIPALDVSNVTDMTYMFAGDDYNLKSILMTNIGADLNISNSAQFERSDLLVILNNLKTVTETKTLTMGATNLAKLTEEDKAIATNKGWTLA